MKHRNIRGRRNTGRALAALLALLALWPAGGARAEGITAAMREEDPRLRRTVTIEANDLYTAELVRLLGEQTGVSLRTRREDGAGDVRVTAVLREVPLADAMDALWSLVSYRQGRWHWWRRGSAGAREYELMRPREAQLLAARLRVGAQAELERHAERMLGALDMTPEQRKALEAVDRAATLIDSSRYNRGGLTAFRELLTPEQRRAVLRGGEVVSSLAGASETVRRYAYSEWEFATSYARENPHPDPRRQVPPPPTRLFFEGKRLPGQGAPMLVIHVEGIGGYSYLGGGVFQGQMRERLYDGWIHAGDLRRHVNGDRRLEPRPVPGPEGTDAKPDGRDAKQDGREGGAGEQWRPAAAARLRELAAAGRLSFLARLDLGDRVIPRAPVEGTVAAYLDRLANTMPYYQSKWRRGILLVTSPAWFAGGAGVTEVPFEVVRELREAQRENGGFLPLEAIGGAVSRLNEEQLAALGEEFPALRGGLYWRGVFRQVGASREAAEQVRSRGGLPMGELREPLARVSDTGLDQALAGGGVARMRITEERKEEERTLWIELLDRRGAVLFRRGTRHPRAAPASASGP